MGEVHVWAAARDGCERDIATLAALLSPDERERAGRFRRPADGLHYTIAHGVLRRILAGYLEAAPESLAFATAERGKPSLVRPPGARAGPDLRFNLSHSGDALAIIVTCGGEVGVDVESPERACHADDLAQRHFPPEEWESLRRLPEAERRAHFLRSWVCKEAFAKATGSGLGRIAFQSVAAVAAPSGLLTLVGTSAAARRVLEGWCVVELPAFRGYPAALAVQGAAPRTRCWLWPVS